MTNAILRAGADVKAANTAGITPLHAAVTGEHSTCVGLLLAQGASGNSRTMDGDTALHLAAKNKTDEITKMLLEHSALPDQTRPSPSGQQVSPLDIARAEGNDATVERLERALAFRAAERAEFHGYVVHSSSSLMPRSELSGVAMGPAAANLKPAKVKSPASAKSTKSPGSSKSSKSKSKKGEYQTLLDD